MPRWLSKVLKRIRQLAASDEVRLTYKAEREMLLLGLSPEDVRDVIAALGFGDSAGRLISETTGEWMYLFKPEVGGQTIYVKLAVRENCAVVSFHQDEGGGHEDDD
jgi:hypothetical protein